MNEAGLKLTLYNWLSSQLGQPHIFTITFDSDFVAGNVINASFDAEAMAMVNFTTSHANTMILLARAIQRTAEVFTAVVTGPRQITVAGLENGDTIVVTGPVVTGGLTQPVATVVSTQSPSTVLVVHSDQVAPAPLYPYAVIRIDSIVKTQFDETRIMDEEANIASIGGQRRATVSISCFGNNPLQMASQARNSLSKRTVLDQLSSAGIAIISTEPILNLTTVLETEEEKRADFDFFIGFADSIGDDLGVIESVELTGEYRGTAGPPIVVGPRIISSV